MRKGTYLAIILYADNYWLIARSADVLKKMTTEWLRFLRSYGWDTPLSELTWTTTLTKARFSRRISIQDVVICRADREVGFKALGTRVTFNGSNSLELKARMARAWRAFMKYADILCNQNSCLQRRLKMLTILINGALFWCSGSWNLTNDQLSNLRGLQQKMLRRMIGRRRHRQQSLEEYMIDTNRMIKSLKLKHSIQDWDITALSHHFGWAGHIRRLSDEDPDRVTGLI